MEKSTLKPTSLPLYLQLSEFLIREIESGRLVDGDKLPTERAMARQYKTTVSTLRKSLAILENQKLLERVHGSGNYVRKKSKVDSVYSMFRIELCAGGGLPTAKVLSVVEMPKPEDLPEFGTSHRATRIRRLRFLDNQPIAVEEIWLDRNAGPIEPEQLQDSLYRYYKMKLGFWISSIEDRVGISVVPDWAPPEIGLNVGRSAGYIERHSWAQEPHAIEFSRTWFDSNKCNYVQRLK